LDDALRMNETAVLRAEETRKAPVVDDEELELNALRDALSQKSAEGIPPYRFL
jgi:hypothetical protein